MDADFEEELKDQGKCEQMLDDLLPRDDIIAPKKKATELFKERKKDSPEKPKVESQASKVSSRQTGALERMDPSKPVKESELVSLRPKESEQMSKISL